MTQENLISRSQRKKLVGVVTSKSGEKTVKVVYYYKKPHPLYKKEIKRRTVLHVHDEQNNCQIGDTVQIMETRPLSRTKRWRVVRIIQSAVSLENS